MSKHTSGPWRVHRHHKPISDQWIFTVITDEEYGDVICGTCTAPQWLDETRRLENAQLIAAAPELLEALESALTILIDSVGDFDYDKARAAIAKAKGETK